MSVLSAFGLVALLLAAAGIYGVLSHLVAQRSSEIGVRMTLGARPRDIVRMVLREALAQAVLGLSIGVLGGVLVMRAFRAALYEVSPTDPMRLFAVTALLTATAALACVLPARRAMRVDPVMAIRQG